MDGNSISVDGVVFYMLEDNLRIVDGVDDSREIGFSKDNVGSILGSVGGIFDSDIDVGMRKSRGIVGIVISYGIKVIKVLDMFDNFEFVFREDISEIVGVYDYFVKVGVFVISFGIFF